MDTQAEFTALVERHRHELRVHCYRMVGSFEESEDLVQETFLRAWRAREQCQSPATVRAWLYRIATNASLDAITARPQDRQVAVTGDGARTSEVSWLQPYPDHLLDLAAPSAEEPDAVVLARETIELAYLVALQHLPARQRAVLVLRDVVGQPATEVAKTLGSTTASVNSALQRARATLREYLPAKRGEWSAAGPTAAEKEVLARFVAATDSSDLAAFGELLHLDALQTMPPEPFWQQGREDLLESWGKVMSGPESWGQWRALPTFVNRQPALANYVRKPGEDHFRVVALDVLRVHEGQVAEVSTFGPEWVTACGLPEQLPTFVADRADFG
ncbi:RNA polymerase sigma-70 factor (ECF subfamily) [Crossiella equi]|uniref:RNA polymerase sigma factor n=1 Tax=Crossiella equi TaxID=130796 RepID=A0ABS5A6P0_9PSEU|nr:RNA polymerase sigma-70 factor (ECF subfamily) [Crossiella equi]